MYRSCHPLSTTTESVSQKTERSKVEPDAASASTGAEKQLQDIVETLSKEKESLLQQVADFQVFYFVTGL